jgi:hypothetical protein
MLAASSLKRNPTLSSATKKKVEENILKVELLLYVGQRSKKAVSSKTEGKLQCNYWWRYCNLSHHIPFWL